MNDIEKFLYTTSSETEQTVVREMMEKFCVDKCEALSIYRKWRNIYILKPLPSEAKEIKRKNLIKRNNDHLPNLIESIDKIGVYATATKFNVNINRLVSIYSKVKKIDVNGIYDNSERFFR